MSRVLRIRQMLRIGEVRPEDSLYEFRRTLGAPAWVVVTLVVGLWVTMVLCAHHEYLEKGSVYGYAGPAVMTLFVPIYEELIFRGWILTRLVRALGNGWAIVLSSLLFGLWHLRNISWIDAGELRGQMIFAGVVFGPIAGYVALRFRSLWPAVVLHYANNLLYFLP